MPPVKPEKTGSPTAPISTYTSTARVPRLPPSRPTARKTPMVCKVKGICPGMEIQAQMAIRQAKRPI